MGESERCEHGIPGVCFCYACYLEGGGSTLFAGEAELEFNLTSLRTRLSEVERERDEAVRFIEWIVETSEDKGLVYDANETLGSIKKITTKTNGND